METARLRLSATKFTPFYKQLRVCAAHSKINEVREACNVGSREPRCIYSLVHFFPKFVHQIDKVLQIGTLNLYRAIKSWQRSAAGHQLACLTHCFRACANPFKSRLKTPCDHQIVLDFERGAILCLLHPTLQGFQLALQECIHPQQVRSFAHRACTVDQQHWK